LSIAIGKSGQNVRLASKLTEYELDIEADKTDAPVSEDNEQNTTHEQHGDRVATTTLPKQPKLKKKSDLENSLLASIEEHGE
jgi:transcription antitermination factor NusA-like protein